MSLGSRGFERKLAHWAFAGAWSIAFAIALLTESVMARSADAERCEHLLSVSWTLLEGGPVLKEELATGIMWMRLDAERRRDSGDTAGCVQVATEVERLLRRHRTGAADPSDR